MSAIHPTAVEDEGATVGAVTGERCSVGQNVFVGNCMPIGNNVKIQNNV